MVDTGWGMEGKRQDTVTPLHTLLVNPTFTSTHTVSKRGETESGSLRMGNENVLTWKNSNI